jgi:hypothetical protein
MRFVRCGKHRFNLDAVRHIYTDNTGCVNVVLDHTSRTHNGELSFTGEEGTAVLAYFDRDSRDLMVPEPARPVTKDHGPAPGPAVKSERKGG